MYYRNAESSGKADTIIKVAQPRRESVCSKKAGRYKVEDEILALHDEAMTGPPVTAKELARKIAKDSALQKVQQATKTAAANMASTSRIPKKKKLVSEDGPSVKRHKRTDGRKQEEIPFIPVFVRLHRLQETMNRLSDQIKALNNRLTAAPESDDDMPEHDSTPPSAVASTT
ncbi:unnamed protein product [Caenorhabditis auriculariae]|uniref:Uncharacterized protein n=1 Tax=Caenorhabditis auriculariae TaxID=2777116 RepID=A0A8S1HLF9_9PELO|nr:unnamed protein product [Caenorhabditis auriculariae]